VVDLRSVFETLSSETSVFRIGDTRLSPPTFHLSSPISRTPPFFGLMLSNVTLFGLYRLFPPPQAFRQFLSAPPFACLLVTKLYAHGTLRGRGFLRCFSLRFFWLGTEPCTFPVKVLAGALRLFHHVLSSFTQREPRPLFGNGECGGGLFFFRRVFHRLSVVFFEVHVTVGIVSV